MVANVSMCWLVVASSSTVQHNRRAQCHGARYETLAASHAVSQHPASQCAHWVAQPGKKALQCPVPTYTLHTAHCSTLPPYTAALTAPQPASHLPGLPGAPRPTAQHSMYCTMPPDAVHTSPAALPGVDTLSMASLLLCHPSPSTFSTRARSTVMDSRWKGAPVRRSGG